MTNFSMSSYELDARQDHYQQTVWARLVTILLGVWLITSPHTFGYTSTAMTVSDIITGILVIIFGILSLSYKREWPSWIVALLGVWLQFAPLVFWAPNAAAYLNDTIVGVLLITFSILVTGLPWEGARKGPEFPKGWSYNPSSWHQRLPVIAFGCLGWFISRYLAAYQLGYIDQMWDPFFGDGTLKVITSNLSKSFPISDAGLGAMAYCLEALLGCKGSVRRWHTMPWLVVFFGILVLPLGFVSILLVISQPVIVGAWCGWCLIAATGMLIMMALTIDEVVAVMQFLSQCKREGKPMGVVFWKGDIPTEGDKDLRTPPFGTEGKTFSAMVWGTSVPWNLFLCALIGIWVMASSAFFTMQRAEFVNIHILGAIIITFAVVAWSEVARALRYIVTLSGVWIILSSWIFATDDSTKWNNVIVGVLLILLSLRKGKIKETYGTWNRYIF